MGRHRKIDVEKALDAAVCVFWRKGYEGASYTDLTEAAGVERPALYSAFGNKEELFRRALARYYEHYLDFIPEALSKPTAREVAAHILYRSIELHTYSPEHTGCLGINGFLAGSDDAEPIRQMVILARAEGQEIIQKRFERAHAEGDLPETTDPAALTTYLMAVVHGIAVQAKAGFDRETLQLVAKQVLAGWPSP
ncbi:TetR/AcrR family transcriptional regulator [Thalassospira marina]|uniref:TetR family transcriptional regulator n=1 Tax=Thalassospira marina TaxID=2048283 RepID=A0ABM6QH82_9PROT|nr:TetR/AcrR family transcriptional regulator [Thalassospira marina]AUG55963.1 TetR family transcriptional regulator [Thalassospira marina]